MFYYVKPFSDMFVKYLLGSKGNEPMLLSFINGVLSNAGFPEIVKIDILNPFKLKKFKEDKLSVLDIKAKDDVGNLYNIEIPSVYERDYKLRSLYYWAKLYSSQLIESDPYGLLRPTVSINLLNFSLMKESDRYHSWFYIVNNDYDKDPLLTDHFSVHYIELSKFFDCLPETSLGNWLYFFKYEGKGGSNMKYVLEKDEILKEADKRYENFIQDDDLREAYDNLMKGRRALYSGLKDAKDEGEQLGLKKGERKGAIAIAKNLKALNLMSTEKIAQATGLSVEDVEQL